MNNLKEFEFSNIFRKLKNKDLILITSVIYFAIILLYELFYCNFEFVSGVITSYNFSLYRIIVYCVICFIFYKVKDKFINNVVNTLSSKVKCYFIVIIFFFTIVFSITLIYLITKNLNINIIIAFISILVFNLFAFYVSNDIIKNVIITALLFGIICSISVTFNNQLDEKRHFLSSYSVALGGFNLESPKVDTRVAEMPRMMNTEQFIEYFSEKPTGEITEEFSAERIEDTPNNYMMISYLVSGVGIFVSKTLGRKYCRHIYNGTNF